MSRGKRNCIWYRLCTYTIRKPRRRVPTMRRKSVETCRHRAKSPAGWGAHAHLTQGKVCGWHCEASSGGGFGHGHTLPTQNVLHTTACALNCFYFLSNFSFKGQQEVSFFGDYPAPRTMKMSLIMGNKSGRKLTSEQVYVPFICLSTCYLVFSPVILERGKCHWGSMGKE